eukprot:CAMPEP_0185196824 /NCGR_PEP_ID=MMETSP1140-20130426/38681_1 /TAXON_ID=298111 /ORGANISM="Pavlova sp., Strain CCMP459" /LENGTH=66 /DNA_ID=CAMNT_0027763893 /DNA_START=79 /DNA_END=276 /DNA_ORIENTATION=+
MSSSISSVSCVSCASDAMPPMNHARTNMSATSPSPDSTAASSSRSKCTGARSTAEAARPADACRAS